MKKIYIIYFLFALTGCSNKEDELKNKYQAWSNTYWGMPEYELLNYISENNSASNINKSNCGEEYIKKKNLESCTFISLKNYQIGNQHYNLGFRLDNNQLSNIHFSHVESSEILFKDYNGNIDILLRQQRQMQEVSWAASLELLELLSSKYGEPTQKNISEENNLSLEAIWEKEYTIIELNNVGIMPTLNYKPNKTSFYLDTVPNDLEKL